jgi:hypothetical protein
MSVKRKVMVPAGNSLMLVMRSFGEAAPG